MATITKRLPTLLVLITLLALMMVQSTTACLHYQAYFHPKERSYIGQLTDNGIEVCKRAGRQSIDPLVLNYFTCINNVWAWVESDNKRVHYYPRGNHNGMHFDGMQKVTRFVWPGQGPEDESFIYEAWNYGC